MNYSRQRTLQLFHFMCAFAWADLEVQEEERAMIELALAGSLSYHQKIGLKYSNGWNTLQNLMPSILRYSK